MESLGIPPEPTPETPQPPSMQIEGPDGHIFAVSENTAPVDPLGHAPNHTDSLQFSFPEHDDPLNSVENVTALTDTAEIPSFLEPVVEPKPIAAGSLLLGGVAAAVARKRASRAVHGRLARRHERKANELEQSAKIISDAAKANLKTVRFPEPKDPRDMKPLDRIIAENPHLAPLKRVGVVDPVTGEKVRGTALHFDTRDPGKGFHGARQQAVTDMIEGRHNPTGTNATSNRQLRQIRSLNRTRNKLVRAGEEMSLHTQAGPYGELLLPHRQEELEAYLNGLDGAKMTPKQKKDIQQKAKDIRGRIAKKSGRALRRLENEAEDEVSGTGVAAAARNERARRHRDRQQKHEAKS